MKAALALPILVLPAKAAAAEVGEVGITVLGYKERGLMKVTEPVLWARAQFLESWEVQASAAVDIITGASAQLVSNASGRPVQSISGASINDRRNTGDVKVTRRFGDFSLSASRALSKEEDYRSKSFGLEARLDLNQRNTTLVAGYGASNDRVLSSDDARLNERRDTREYLFGVTQILSPTALVQSTFSASRGHGWYNDPYKLTFTFFSEGTPILVADRRPDHRDSYAWLTRYRWHFPEAGGTLQADYRYYRDDWGIRAHTLELAWQHALSERWSVRPALRYYTQDAADFYSPTVPRPRPAILSSDQRLGAWGGVSPSLRVAAKLDDGVTVEGTLGYVHNARNLHLGGASSPAFETLRAVYGILGVSHTF
ncbi:MAG: porin [Usitatibacter sp.]